MSAFFKVRSHQRCWWLLSCRFHLLANKPRVFLRVLRAKAGMDFLLGKKERSPKPCANLAGIGEESKKTARLSCLTANAYALRFKRTHRLKPVVFHIIKSQTFLLGSQSKQRTKAAPPKAFPQTVPFPFAEPINVTIP